MRYDITSRLARALVGAALGCGLATAWAAPTPPARGLTMEVVASGAPLALNRPGALHDRRQRPLAVTRLDLLLSDFRLRRADGRWTEPGDWHGFFRADAPARREVLPPIPPGSYVAAQFTVGVSPAANHADPNRLPPDHPLHPVVNGLHWGWTGGYVFLAVEGHWPVEPASAGETAGFSYHLGGNDNRVTVELPVRLALGATGDLRLRLDATQLLRGIDIARDGESTHSRRPDAPVRALKRALGGAFSIRAAAGDAARPGAPSTAATARAAAPAAGAAYPLVWPSHFPRPELPPDNPLTVDGVALGARLFVDRRLSRDGIISCASCHDPAAAFADPGRAVSTGVDGRRGRRNAMPLFNLAWVDNLFWDGRVRGLRHQVLHPIEDPDEMGETLPRVVARLAADRSMAEAFQRAFGAPPSAQRIGLALEQYLLTQLSHDSPFDRFGKGAQALTAQERRGLELFLTEHDPAQGLFGADCFHCHGGPLFTNQRFANNGLPVRAGDTGREAVTRDSADRHKFRTPSLRNVAVTAPYMHDGRFRTLEEVVEHYDRGVQRTPTLDPNLAKHPRAGLGLSAEDKAALVAFLRTLTDPAFAAPRARGAAAR